MLLFAHIGITAGVAKTCDVLSMLAKPHNIQESDSPFGIISVFNRMGLKLYPFLIGIKRRLSPVDYRMVLVGSLLPDIIDKPVLLMFGNQASLSGHDYAHTLLFNLVLLTGGLILTGYGKSWLLIISLSSLMHLILDRMWESPVVLFWPLLGSLPEEEKSRWLYNIYHSLFIYPGVYIPEIVGFVIISLFMYRLVKRKSVSRFVREGIID